jgi:hypothetical protein
MLFTMSDSISAAPDTDRRDDQKSQKHKSINQYSVRIQNEQETTENANNPGDARPEYEKTPE